MKRLFIITILFTTVALLMAQPKPAQVNNVKASIERGRKMYNQICLSCHMADGGGAPHLNPPLIQTEYVLGDKSRLIQIVLKGMKEKLVIDDEAYSNIMAPHNYLTDQQIADVLTYIRNNFGNKVSAVTLAEVKAARNTGKQKK